MKSERRGSPHRIQGTGADTAGRHIDHPFEGAVIVTIGEQTQIRECVPDLGTFVKAQATVDTIG